jgi:hypothetical protein
LEKKSKNIRIIKSFVKIYIWNLNLMNNSVKVNKSLKVNKKSL